MSAVPSPGIWNSTAPAAHPPFAPFFPPFNHPLESAATSSVISTLGLMPHLEDGYCLETDRDTLAVPNPFVNRSSKAFREDPTHSASTTIYYYLTPSTPFGAFYRNNGRTAHTLHSGRGRYVLWHVDEPRMADGGVPVETFTVGHNLTRGERLQWIVEGDKYKASYLLPDTDEGSTSNGLLTSEVLPSDL